MPTERVQHSDGATANGTPGPEPAQFDILDLVITLAKYKKLILALPLAVSVTVAIYSLTLPNMYTATSRMLPPQQQQSGLPGIFGQLGAIAGAAGGSLGIKNPTDLYIGMLKSRTVADNIVKRFDLQKIYGINSLEAARGALAGRTAITAGRDGIITVQYEDQDRKLAADVTNAYTEELYRLTQTLAVTEASQRRLFFEKQLRGAKEGLSTAEQAMRKTQESTGLIKLDDQGRAIIEAVARVRAEIAAKEVQLAAMRTFATEQNAGFVLLSQELSALRGQLAKMERAGSVSDGSTFVPTGRIPEAGQEYVRKLRDLKYYETIFELMAKQYELARIDEARDSSIVQVLDQAVEPEQKSSPARASMVLTSGFIALFASILIAFAIEAVRRTGANRQQVERWYTLKRYLSWR
jgi:uncharacterized protein involved in exopolysaccharide biosynthesis